MSEPRFIFQAHVGGKKWSVPTDSLDPETVLLAFCKTLVVKGEMVFARAHSGNELDLGLLVFSRTFDAANLTDAEATFVRGRLEKAREEIEQRLAGGHLHGGGKRDARRALERVKRDLGLVRGAP